MKTYYNFRFKSNRSRSFTVVVGWCLANCILHFATFLYIIILCTVGYDRRDSLSRTLFTWLIDWLIDVIDRAAVYRWSRQSWIIYSQKGACHYILAHNFTKGWLSWRILSPFADTDVNWYDLSCCATLFLHHVDEQWLIVQFLLYHGVKG